MTSRTIDDDLVTELSHMDADFLRSMTYAMAYFKTHCQPPVTGTGTLTDLERRQMVSAQTMLRDRLSIMGWHVREMEFTLNRHQMAPRRRRPLTSEQREKLMLIRNIARESSISDNTLRRLFAAAGRPWCCHTLQLSSMANTLSLTIIYV